MSMKNWSLSFSLKFLSHFVQFTSWSLMNYFISYCVFLDANYKTTHNKPWVWWREKHRSNFSRTRKVRRWLNYIFHTYEQLCWCHSVTIVWHMQKRCWEGLKNEYFMKSVNFSGIRHKNKCNHLPPLSLSYAHYLLKFLFSFFLTVLIFLFIHLMMFVFILIEYWMHCWGFPKFSKF